MIFMIVTIWMTVVVMFAQLVVKIPHVLDYALMAGNAHGSEIKVHIDSGAARHFISYARLFSSWENGVLDVNFNTAVGEPVTFRAVGTLKFLAMDVHQNVRAVTQEHAYYVLNQPHNMLSVCVTNIACCSK